MEDQLLFSFPWKVSGREIPRSFLFYLWKVLLKFFIKQLNFTDGRVLRWEKEVGTLYCMSFAICLDDSLIFYGAERSQVMYMNLTVIIFEAISGLHMNMLKTFFFP